MDLGFDFTEGLDYVVKFVDVGAVGMELCWTFNDEDGDTTGTVIVGAIVTGRGGGS